MVLILKFVLVVWAHHIVVHIEIFPIIWRLCYLKVFWSPKWHGEHLKFLERLLPIWSLVLSSRMGFHFGIQCKQLTRVGNVCWQCVSLHQALHHISYLRLTLPQMQLSLDFWFILRTRDWIVINLGCFMNIES
jgi:hypothetical protein